MIYGISLPQLLPTLQPFPAFLHMQGCSLVEPILFKLSWCVSPTWGALALALTLDRAPILMFESQDSPLRSDRLADSLYSLIVRVKRYKVYIRGSFEPKPLSCPPAL